MAIKNKSKNNVAKVRYSGGKQQSFLITDFLQYKAILDDDHHSILLTNGHFMDMFNLPGHDLDYLAEDEQLTVMSDYEAYGLVYGKGWTILNSTLPADTKIQQAFWANTLGEINDNLAIETNERKQAQLLARQQTALEELQLARRVVEHVDHLQFTFIMFADSQSQLKELRENALKNGGVAVQLQELSVEDKIRILKQFNNPNNMLTRGN
ncbi:hypothetical protein EQG49_00245 [Periweissella cryptocerci]|uniref:Uncharacterized protein n=1 Tax=Periweissella cryptocerci TaxID=2506420 RepID=A0A4P6YQW0_9LACO|nr:hypothetical protein [Periweissella cryptocerci]QBO34984.1 hypothetical protein EQG49_00245 [Periweissella cryptocerci]